MKQNVYICSNNNENTQLSTTQMTENNFGEFELTIKMAFILLQPSNVQGQKRINSSIEKETQDILTKRNDIEKDACREFLKQIKRITIITL